MVENNDIAVLDSMYRKKSGQDQARVNGDSHANSVMSVAPTLEEREKFYHEILDNLADGVIVTDQEDRILFANSHMLAISGYRRDELIGHIGYELLLSRPQSNLIRERLKKRRVGAEEHFELELVRKDGMASWVRVMAKPFPNGSGEIWGTVNTMVCIDRQKHLEQENEYFLHELRVASGHGDLIGSSAALARIREQIKMVAPTQSIVLISGESGTGKELVARAIHELSKRRLKPLVSVNCAAIPYDLFASEFFGHVKGAFTGALRDRIGRFELADGGTLFLDEIGELPTDLQSKLLRVIQEGQFERVGEERTRSIDVRLISATNRDLASEVAAGRFRSDLYYRLSVFPISVPPLRERREDILPIAEHCLKNSAQKLRIKVPRLTPIQAEMLRNYDWPGNVRELQNVMERAAILAGYGDFSLDIDPNLSFASLSHSATHPASMKFNALAKLVDMEKELLVSALKEARGKIYGSNGAAALLGLKPTTLASKMTRLGLKRDDFMRG